MEEIKDLKNQRIIPSVLADIDEFTILNKKPVNEYNEYIKGRGSQTEVRYQSLKRNRIKVGRSDSDLKPRMQLTNEQHEYRMPISNRQEVSKSTVNLKKPIQDQNYINEY